MGAVGLPLLEVVTVGGHGVSDVRDADHVEASDLGEGVERSGFHLDRDDSQRFRVDDRVGSLAVGGVGGPCRPGHHRLSEPAELPVEAAHEVGRRV